MPKLLAHVDALQRPKRELHAPLCGKRRRNQPGTALPKSSTKANTKTTCRGFLFSSGVPIFRAFHRDSLGVSIVCLKYGWAKMNHGVLVVPVEAPKPEDGRPQNRTHILVSPGPIAASRARARRMAG